MQKKKAKRAQRTIRCPYCGAVADIRPAAEIYQDPRRTDELYVCRNYSQQKLYAQEILDAMKDPNDDIPKMVISSTAKFLSNILEDGYVDARYSYEFPGNPARGIALNNLRIAEKAPDIQTMINKKFYDHTIVLNLLVQYVNSGEVNNLSGYSGELLDLVMDFIPIVDDCLMDEDARSRCEASNRIMIDLWPIMQRCFDALRDKKQEAQNQQQTASNSPSSAPGQAGNISIPDLSELPIMLTNLITRNLPQ